MAGRTTRRLGAVRARALEARARPRCTWACPTPATRPSKSWSSSTRCGCGSMRRGGRRGRRVRRESPQRRPAPGEGHLAPLTWRRVAHRDPGRRRLGQTGGQAMTWILVALLGLVAGVVSGLFGVGGAIVIIPGLVLIAKLPQHTAHGTSLAALLLPVGILGALEYYKRGQINIAYAAVVPVGLLIAAYFGARLAGTMSDATLRKAFGVFLLLISIKLLAS